EPGPAPPAAEGDGVMAPAAPATARAPLTPRLRKWLAMRLAPCFTLPAALAPRPIAALSGAATGPVRPVRIAPSAVAARRPPPAEVVPLAAARVAVTAAPAVARPATKA